MVAVSESLQRAIEHHEAGELEQAEVLYREIIRVDPGHSDALHLLGVAAHQKADHRTGAEYIAQAIVRGGASPLHHSNLGACYRSMNRLPDAIASFREAVRLDPRFVGARYNLAMALEAAGSPDEAVREYREVLRIEPNFVQSWNNLGSLLARLGRDDEAIDCHRRAVALAADSAEFHYNLANTLARSGRCAEAVLEYRESIRLSPAIADTHNNLATALHALGHHEEALAEVTAALELRPEFTEALANRETIREVLRNRLLATETGEDVGEIALPVAASPKQWCDRGARFQAEGGMDSAADCYRRVLELDPNCAAAYFGLGYGLLLREDLVGAEKYYEQGLLLDDSDAAAWNNLGSIYTAQEKWDEAAACYESSLQIDAASARAHHNLGNIYKERGQLSDASACYRRAIYIDPQLAEAHTNLGVVLTQQRRLAEAVESHTRAIQLRPNDAKAHFHRALTWLLMGELERGWDEFEWRWRWDSNPREFSFPAWDGRDLDGKSILVYGEQGVGDEIQFASCLPELLRLAPQCLIECEPRLVPLFARSFPLADVVGAPLRNDEAESYGIDVHVAAGSLPGILRRSLEAFPRRRRYLAACPERRAVWRDRYDQLGPGPKVGIAWRGGSHPSTKRLRSTRLEQWQAVFALPGIHFVNLQHGDSQAELQELRAATGVAIHHWPDADPLKDLDGLAAQIAELDLVVSVDNATVHMAGGLGVPVWNLLHFAPNWRWMLGRDDTPWYSSMRLVRQPKFGDWSTVFESVAEGLRNLLTTRASKTTPQRRALLARSSPPLHTQAAPSAASALGTPTASALSAPVDAQAAEERAKYQHIWKYGEYRHFSPGAAAIEKVALVDALRKHGVRTVLDAGCGSGKLMWRLMNEYAGEFDVHGFDITDNCLDPCFDSIKDRVLTIGCLWNPQDFTRIYDAVICADVMEHIPTERVPAVLENLRKSTRRLAFFSIATVADVFGPQLIGAPLHLTIKKPNWWFARLALAGFRVESQAVARAANGDESQLYVFATV